jgi:integrase
MIDVEKLSRNVINARVNRIRRMFKWGVAEELLPPSVVEGLRAVDGLRRGRSHARETEPVRPVDDAVVEATLAYLPPPLADMVRLQRLTSMRPGNLVRLRWMDVDRSGEIWLYRPVSHKTAYLGKDLTIPLGPKAQGEAGFRLPLQVLPGPCVQVLRASR